MKRPDQCSDLPCRIVFSRCHMRRPPCIGQPARRHPSRSVTKRMKNNSHAFISLKDRFKDQFTCLHYTALVVYQASSRDFSTSSLLRTTQLAGISHACITLLRSMETRAGRQDESRAGRAAHHVIGTTPSLFLFLAHIYIIQNTNRESDTSAGLRCTSMYIQERSMSTGQWMDRAYSITLGPIEQCAASCSFRPCDLSRRIQIQPPPVALS